MGNWISGQAWNDATLVQIIQSPLQKRSVNIRRLSLCLCLCFSHIIDGAAVCARAGMYTICLLQQKQIPCSSKPHLAPRASEKFLQVFVLRVQSLSLRQSVDRVLQLAEPEIALQQAPLPPNWLVSPVLGPTKGICSKLHKILGA